MKNILEFVAIPGNALFFLWIIYNAIDEGSKNLGPYQLLSYIGLLILLPLNIYHICSKIH